MSLIPGDGIGPEISNSVKKVFAAAQVPIEWEEVNVTPIKTETGTTIPQAAIDSITRNRIALKGLIFVTFRSSGNPDRDWPC